MYICKQNSVAKISQERGWVTPPYLLSGKSPGHRDDTHSKTCLEGHESAVSRFQIPWTGQVCQEDGWQTDETVFICDSHNLMKRTGNARLTLTRLVVGHIYGGSFELRQDNEVLPKLVSKTSTTMPCLLITKEGVRQMFLNMNYRFN